jgi:hypothetical protein
MVVLVVTMSSFVPAAKTQAPDGSPAEEILAVHEGLIAAHLENSTERILSVEAEGYVVVSGGEVLYPTRDERLARFSSYLEATEFEEYRDLIAPRVHVSADGTTGWLITQARIAGIQRDQDGNPTRFESTWAWVELYEKRGGRWLRVGEVSNRKP